MQIVTQFKTAADFWSGMVEPDYQAYTAAPGDLRLALHLANALFHMADWVFHSYEANVKAKFTFTNSLGQTLPVSDVGTFANALEVGNDDFARIRGIANAGKHLKLSNIRPVTNAPSHAANTQSQELGFGEGGFGIGEFGGAKRVMLEGATDMDFETLATNVYNSWKALNAVHKWWPVT